MIDNEIAIKVSHLTKTYRLYDKPIDRLKEALHPLKKQYHKDFYALNDVSFDIKKGETVGIVGKNGAGKSTLLKIITGVLTPTSGTVTTHGRISSLLELGAGFNPDMTGIENIYLQGSLFGIKRRVMEENIQTILDFADIGDFVYQPVKSYSSGMFARLAFAVAINVEPDILIVDEALSVGDAKFQRKCFAKIDNLSQKGTTILLVSHDLESVKSYTNKACYIKNGMNFCFSDTDVVVNRYLNDLFPKEKKEEVYHTKNMANENITDDGYIIPLSDKAMSFGVGLAKFNNIKIQGIENIIFSGNEEITIIIDIEWEIEAILDLCEREGFKKNIIVGMYIESVKNEKIFAFNTYTSGVFIDIYTGLCKVKFSFTMPVLAPGEYFLVPSIALGEHRVHTQLCWYDYYGTIVSQPEKGVDFLGMVEIDYRVNV
ncbi:ABC transporter ATP-binding protein [Vibrio gazogenes]|uniref:ABC transporter domain-containing protein n=1 Tax=Vibrio gazogenes TaxID=687 RepID=A0A1Z2SFH8_VIBGA|nr:ABC transporter ATP-binding protein [Vibrio gazogenes]ASA55898.1 hypothetical protein BSQ33_09475 [Vibrio gazogenes]